MDAGPGKHRGYSALPCSTCADSKCDPMTPPVPPVHAHTHTHKTRILIKRKRRRPWLAICSPLGCCGHRTGGHHTAHGLPWRNEYITQTHTTHIRTYEPLLPLLHTGVGLQETFFYYFFLFRAVDDRQHMYSSACIIPKHGIHTSDQAQGAKLFMRVVAARDLDGYGPSPPPHTPPACRPPCW